MALQAAGSRDVTVTYVPAWYAHEGFIAANAAHVREALDRLPEESRRRPG